MGRFEARVCDDGRARRRKDDRRPSVGGVGVSGAEFYDIANVADLLQGREGRPRDGEGMSRDIRATGWVKCTRYIAQVAQRSRLCSL